MSELRVEQLEGFLTNLGLEKEDFTTISTTEVTDYEPFVSKIKSGIQDALMADTSFIDGITKPFKDAPIGKENQLKKAVRKTFGLTMSEDELKRMPFDEMLLLATKNISGNTEEKTKKLQEQLTEYMEKYETLEGSIPTRIQETEQKWQEKFDRQAIREELIGVIAAETQVKKENLPNFTTIYLGFVNQEGLKIQIDSKKALKLVDAEGNPAKNAEGGLLRIKDHLKKFGETINMNIQPKGNTTTTTATSGKDAGLLSIMGKGFGN